jgi:hypothetical protein
VVVVMVVVKVVEVVEVVKVVGALTFFEIGVLPFRGFSD